MPKKSLVILAILLIASLALTACGGGAQAPEECGENANETVCAVIEEGSTIKLGYAGPMTGDYSAFGIDISNAGWSPLRTPASLKASISNC